MKTVLLAVALCVAMVVGAFLVLVAFGTPGADARPLSLGLLAVFPKIHSSVREAVSQKTPGANVRSVASFDAYQIPPLIMLLYLTAVGLAIVEIIPAVGVLLVAVAGNSFELSSAMFPAILFAIFVGFPILFLCGRWAGRRCRYRPLITAAVAGLLIRVIGTLTDSLFIPAAEYRQMFGSGKDELWPIQLAAGSIIFAAILVAGAFLGKKQQLSNYIGYLLNQLPIESRITLVELTYDEVSRMSSSQVRPQTE